MKIKRFVAPTMREALAQVREEQGPDAVIISNRRCEGGIELITAVDYDETLIEEALRRSRPEPAPAPVVAPPPPVPPVAAAVAAATRRSSAAELARALIERATATAPSRRDFGIEVADAAAPASPVASAAASVVRADRAASPAKHAGSGRATAAEPRSAPPVAAPAAPAATVPEADTRPRVVWSQDPEVIAMRREVEGLRQLLQNQLASLAWSDRLRREPVRAGVLRDLSLLGLAPDVARGLAERVPKGADAGEAFRLPLALLMKHLPTVDDGLLSNGGTFAVVGPTGVGKTTTIAKLAARFALAQGAEQVALVSLDHYRIGARDQLLTFARILGVPMHVATSARELSAVLTSLADRRLVLIDTAGMSPRDDRLAAQFATLQAPGAPRPIRTLLTLAANADQLSLDEIARAYAPAKPEAVLLTKLDEAATYGPALSVAIRRALPLAHLCDGQRVPQDVHSAPEKRVWLLKNAVKLAQRARERAGIDEQYMAEHFGKVALHG
jgi:flagellar biosynthesis protein FlhF